MNARHAALLLFPWAALAFAEVPEQINYQGRLVNGTNLVQGTVTIVFGIYTNASGGNALYADTQTVAVVDGLYAAAIGASNKPNGALRSALAQPPCYLQVTVNGTPLTPREPIVSVGYALRATESVKESFIPARSDGGGATELVGSHPAVRVMPGQSTYFTFQMPENMASVTNIYLLGVSAIGEGWEAYEVDLYSTYGGLYESATTHANQMAMMVMPDAGKLMRIQLNMVFTSVSPGDACGLRVSHPGVLGADMRYLGIVLRYTTE